MNSQRNFFQRRGPSKFEYPKDPTPHFTLQTGENLPYDGIKDSGLPVPSISPVFSEMKKPFPKVLKLLNQENLKAQFHSYPTESKEEISSSDSKEETSKSEDCVYSNILKEENIFLNPTSKSNSSKNESSKFYTSFEHNSEEHPSFQKNLDYQNHIYENLHTQNYPEEDPFTIIKKLETMTRDEIVHFIETFCNSIDKITDLSKEELLLFIKQNSRQNAVSLENVSTSQVFSSRIETSEESLMVKKVKLSPSWTSTPTSFRPEKQENPQTTSKDIIFTKESFEAHRKEIQGRMNLNLTNSINEIESFPLSEDPFYFTFQKNSVKDTFVNANELHDADEEATTLFDINNAQKHARDTIQILITTKPPAIQKIRRIQSLILNSPLL